MVFHSCLFENAEASNRYTPQSKFFGIWFWAVSCPQRLHNTPTSKCQHLKMTAVFPVFSLLSNWEIPTVLSPSTPTLHSAVSTKLSSRSVKFLNFVSDTVFFSSRTFHLVLFLVSISLLTYAIFSFIRRIPSFIFSSIVTIALKSLSTKPASASL